MRNFEGYRPHTKEFNRIRLALFFAGLATFALLYDTQPILPDLSKHFGIRPDTATLSVSFATMGLAFAMLVAGPLSEIIGRRKIMFTGLMVASVLGTLTGIVDNWHLHLVMRLIMGVFLSGLPAIALAYLVEELHPSAQASAAGIYIGGNAIGGMSGRMVCGFLADHFGWHVALVFLGAFSVACSLAVIFLLPRSRGFVAAPAKFKVLWDNTRAVFADRGIVLLFVVGSTVMGALAAVLNILAYRLTGAPYHLSNSEISLIFLIWLLGSVSSAMAGKLAARYGQRAVTPWGAVLVLIGALITLAQPLWAIIVGLCVIFVGFFVVHAVASAWVAARASAGVGATGQASSGYMFFYYGGSSIFGSLAGSAWLHSGWWGVVGFTVTLSIVCLVAALILRRVPSLEDKSGPAYDANHQRRLAASQKEK